MVKRVIDLDEDQLDSRGDAAKVIGVVPETIDYYERIGRLLPVTHTAGGIALFRRSDVLRVARDRVRAREARGVA
jgi:DNA-binding transcriptional MerR regulator